MIGAFSFLFQRKSLWERACSRMRFISDINAG